MGNDIKGPQINDTWKKNYCNFKSNPKNVVIKILTILGVISIIFYAHNQMFNWYSYRQVYKISKDMVFIDNEFGWSDIKNKFYSVENFEEIDTKMLLSVLLKQQKEIITNLKNINSKIDLLDIKTSSKITDSTCK